MQGDKNLTMDSAPLQIKNVDTYLPIHGCFFIFFHISCMGWSNEWALFFIVAEGQIL